MKYGAKELAFSLPFVEGLESSIEFRQWVFMKTPLAYLASNCELLSEEMKAKRPNSEYYWRSFYTEKCRCPGCSGQETDILSIFQSNCKSRFSLHIEVKQPTDTFKQDGKQAENYGIRAACWAEQKKGPKSLVDHDRFATALLCSSHKLVDFESHLGYFDTIMTFEEIEVNFPGMYSKELLAA